MQKSASLRLLAFAIVSVSLVFTFQNCGQPGSIAISSVAPNTTLSVPDPITLIAAPSISINNKAEYTNSKNVMVQLHAVGAEEMQISLNGDCSGNADWESYNQNKPMALDNSNQENSVSVRYRKKGAPETSCVQASILHDDIPPVVAIVKNFPAYTSAASVQIDFSASDTGSGIENSFCKSLTGAEAKCSNTIVLSDLGKEGSHSVVIRAVDKAGNESSPVTESFVVDRTAPVISINGPSGAVAATVAVYKIAIIESSGLKSVLCKLSPLENTYKSCTSLNASYSGLASGQYSFDVKATDNAENESVKSLTMEIDLSVPTVVITKGPETNSRSRTPSFEFIGTQKGNPISKFKCALDNEVLSSCVSPKSYNNLADRKYSFSVVGINDLGTESAKQNYEFVVDNVAPVLTITSSPTGRTKNVDAAITLQATDVLSGIKSVKCILNGNSTDCPSQTIKYTSLGDGNYSFVAEATDKAGNVTTSAPVTWKVDTSPDSKISVNMAANPIKETATGTMNISLTQVTDASYECKTVSNGSLVKNGVVTQPTSAVQFIVNEDISCTVSAKNKDLAMIKETVVATVDCGNRVKQGNKCVEFTCISVVELPYSDDFVVPARTSERICYSMKVFNKIDLAASTGSRDIEVFSRVHPTGNTRAIHNPFILGKAMLSFKLDGPRIAKLAGGSNVTAPIKIDNFALVGLYPKAIAPLKDHYSSYGTTDSTVDANDSYILFRKDQIPLKSFGPSGTATVSPLEIIREADTNLSYILDLRALDCGGSRELSNIYLLFQ